MDSFNIFVPKPKRMIYNDDLKQYTAKLTNNEVIA